jgi:hypothetical protein
MNTLERAAIKRTDMKNSRILPLEIAGLSVKLPNDR